MTLGRRVGVALLSLLFIAPACAAADSLGSSAPVIPEGVPPAGGLPQPAIDIDAPGKTSLALTPWALLLAPTTGISIDALRAYGNAAEIMRQTQPECGIAWTTLAGHGYIESHHGTYAGARIQLNGRAEPEIRGRVLDGGKDVARIEDTDGGKLDGDNQFDRAMGPMQFIPGTWELVGEDADGDGIADPDNIDDAALSAAVLLCDSGGDLRTPEGWTKAVWSYNHSDAYVADIREAASAYALGLAP